MAVKVQLIERAGRMVVQVQASGTLTRDDYSHFVPELERFIKEQGKLRVLFLMHDFHGWNGGALWEDAKFDFKHFSDIERLALVGEVKWEEWMAVFCKPFTSAQVQYFDQRQSEEALTWITGD